MQSFPDMAEAHEWTLRRLREMAGRLTEQAYLRASEAQARDGGRDEEAQARWMLVFDRMARGLRLSIALEARLSRERRRDACEIEREVQGERRPRAAQASLESGGDAEPRESDREHDDDGLAADAPLEQRIGRLKAIIEGAGSPEPQPPLQRFEWRALEPQRAERARRAAAPFAPDEPWPEEPWDILAPADRVDAEARPWRGSG
jgi:hypothetical protein